MRAYGEQRDLAFLLSERQLAQKYFAAHTQAQQLGVIADVMTRLPGIYWILVGARTGLTF